MRLVFIKYFLLIELSVASIAYSSPLEDLFNGAKEGDVRKVVSALNRGANIHATSNVWGWSAMHFAARRNAVHVILILQARGQNVNVSDTGNWSPLHVAAWYGQIDAVQQLLHLGADPTQVTSNGQNALEIAQQRKHRAVARLLKRAKKNSIIDLTEAEFPWAIGNPFAPLLLEEAGGLNSF